MSVCPLCSGQVDARLLAKGRELRLPIVQLIQQTEPNWNPQVGICPNCALQYTTRFIAQRRPTSLHTTTNPPTTFPYYHRAEEIVLSQPDRLPDYATFSGRGVTIAFLDSGYYPHPDLSRLSTWPEPMPEWTRLTSDEWQTKLQQAGSRIVQYVDLTHNREGIGLDQPNLWAGDSDSWHGQMTTVLAAGNGLLSKGLFRGYAPQANILAIKIGRGGGRIPEEDILRGLQWLLHDDQWRRYNVRVLNISVGGDEPEAWQNNAVCQAAEALIAKGVLIAAAAGNRGRAELLAPAQAPSVLTVGGYDDANRRWASTVPAERARLTLYPHNYGVVVGAQGTIHKPELLAPVRWLPAPILPVSPVFRETVAIGHLRTILLAQYEPAPMPTSEAEDVEPTWLQTTWQGVRKGMNAHKWVHPYYQHVDGTSVAVAQVSGVAAQMFEANPNLTVVEARAFLLDTALPFFPQSVAETGHGILQPIKAVAAALRTPNGILAGLPHSATLIHPNELQNWVDQGTVSALANEPVDGQLQAVYFGYYAPQAAAVSLLGSFNDWQPGHLPLQRLSCGWWQIVAFLPQGSHPYRFWIDTGPYTPAVWQPDPENSVRQESGYEQGHSVIVVG
ncbi:MAG: S8 family serine peptidase [Chloroflexi bacterium]|nr:S8 family serine peptidase [Chloroflexota bacterium]